MHHRLCADLEIELPGGGFELEKMIEEEGAFGCNQWQIKYISVSTLLEQHGVVKVKLPHYKLFLCGQCKDRETAFMLGRDCTCPEMRKVINNGIVEFQALFLDSGHESEEPAMSLNSRLTSRFQLKLFEPHVVYQKEGV